MQKLYINRDLIMQKFSVSPYLVENKTLIKIKQDTQFKIGKSYSNYVNYSVIRDILNDFNDGIINRKKVTKYFVDGKLEHGFFSAMIWGGISTGGPSGDNLSLLLAVKKDRLLTVITTVHGFIVQNNFSQAYLYMETEGKLVGLGDSFFTKLFFFLAQANGQVLVPPIFDKWTKLAYCALLIDTGDVKTVNKYISSVKGPIVNFRSRLKSEAYEDYVLKMNHWAKSFEASVSSLECFIFGNDKRQDKSASNPRNVFECMASKIAL